MSGIDERKVREPISLVEDDTLAELKYLSRRPIGHHLIVAIDKWHASPLRRLPVKLKAFKRSRRRYRLAGARRNIRE
jgi:hypothetical protein